MKENLYWIIGVSNPHLKSLMADISSFRRFWVSMILVLGGLTFFCGSAEATITLPAIISNHAVLQKSDKTRIWGKGAPQEHVKVTLGTAKGEVDADAGGLWHIDLDLSKSPEGPFDLVVEGSNKIVVADVLVGEVWICSGQSNMDRPMNLTEGWEQEVAQSANNRLRAFHVGSKTKDGLQPQDDCGGKWEIASPATTPAFTAVGYYFAKKLIQILNAPVGLIHSAVGGSEAESWMTPETVDKDPRLTPTRDKILAQIAADPTGRKAYVDATHAWEATNNRADQPTPDPSIYAGVDVDTTGWKPVTLPGKLSDAGLPDSGVVWLRKKVTIPPNLSDQVWISMLSPGGFESIYWNGQPIVAVTPENVALFGGGPRRYPVAPSHLHEGENVVAIRLFSPMGGAGINGEAKYFVAGPIPIGGEWLAKAQVEFPPIDPELAKTYPVPPHAREAAASSLYNGRIAPLVNETIKGVLWYQGESNAPRAYQYRTTFPELITGWREKWGWDMPFYFCQLANFLAKKNVPDESTWAELREAQSKTLSLPKTGQAVLIDIGEQGDIHSRDKKDVGDRLALIALAHDYGQTLEDSGPVYDSMTVEGDAIRLKFTHLGGGLVAKPLPAEYKIKSTDPTAIPLVRNSPNSELEGFAICGDDHKWVWADAKIDGDSIVVSSSKISNPLAVRYAWADNPTCDLYNKADLPASPFRTDDFAESTASASY